MTVLMRSCETIIKSVNDNLVRKIRVCTVFKIENCGVLIGLSRFLHLFRSVFFVLFSAEWACEFRKLHSHLHTLFCSSNRPASLHFIPLRSIPFVHSGHCFFRKKTSLHGKNRAIPADCKKTGLISTDFQIRKQFDKKFCK